MIVTIDGPAGSGKSSAARELARRLRFEFLDTGAMYRAVSFAFLRDRNDETDSSALERWLPSVRLEAPPGVVRLDGEDIAARIRTPEITALASRLAAVPAVRHFLVGLQRGVAGGRDLVCEGRDQGTVVFPDAERKFFLVADREERARRRQRELASRGIEVPFGEVLRAQDERDERDAHRDLAPMRPADDAIILDSTRLTPDQVVARMEAEVRRCLPSFPPSSTSSASGSSSSFT
ncbi:MAG TPA: (d)CMP kinase [Gemmataceae bacterium]|nr:(d)CMP kinase [Gemmataceae bacterium]